MNDIIDTTTGAVSASVNPGDTDITPGLRIIGTLEARAKLSLELAAAVAEFTPIPKSRHVKFFSKKTGATIEYDYATYSDLRKAIDGPLGQHGVVVSAFPHSVTPDSGGYRVTTLVAGHGAEIWSTLALPKRQEWDMKILGGDFTYLRRYGCAAAVGVEGDLDADDLPAEENQVPYDEPAPRAATAKRSAEPKAEPKPKSRPQSDRPPPQEPLASKKQLDEVQDILRQLGYGAKPEALKVRTREILGFTPPKNEKGRSIFTKTQADALIQGFSAELAARQSQKEPEPDFDEPDFGATGFAPDGAEYDP